MYRLHIDPAAITYINRLRRYRVTVKTQEEHDKLMNEKIDQTKTVTENLEDDSASKVIGQMVPFISYQVKAAEIQNQQQESKPRTIQVINIPIETTKDQIMGVFSKFGSI